MSSEGLCCSACTWKVHNIALLPPWRCTKAPERQSSARQQRKGYADLMKGLFGLQRPAGSSEVTTAEATAASGRSRAGRRAGGIARAPAAALLAPTPAAATAAGSQTPSSCWRHGSRRLGAGAKAPSSAAGYGCTAPTPRHRSALRPSPAAAPPWRPSAAVPVAPTVQSAAATQLPALARRSRRRAAANVLWRSQAGRRRPP